MLAKPLAIVAFLGLVLFMIIRRNKAQKNKQSDGPVK